MPKQLDNLKNRQARVLIIGSYMRVIRNNSDYPPFFLVRRIPKGMFPPFQLFINHAERTHHFGMHGGPWRK